MILRFYFFIAPVAVLISSSSLVTVRLSSLNVLEGSIGTVINCRLIGACPCSSPFALSDRRVLVRSTTKSD